LSVFFENTRLNRWNEDGTYNSPSAHRLLELLRNLGLTSGNTPPLQHFPASVSEAEAAARTAKDGNPRPVFPYGEQATEFMQDSPANTFAVTYAYWDGNSYKAHTLLAVKKPDGSIVYLDLQTRPPEAYHYLDPHHFSVFATPTDIDWRFNRTLYGYIESTQPKLQQNQDFRPTP
jgi:hypothetical protein